jgi:hypothetical protein
MTKVKNIDGTSDTKCKCGTWLDHWKKFSGQTVTYCCEKTCTNKELVGAHVQKADSTDSYWYIIPLCHSHNKTTGELELSDGYRLVRANKQVTCELPNRPEP